MTEDQGQTGQEHKDFFISYTSVDRQWAEWIAFELEAAGYHTIIQAWDFRPGSNFVANMDVAAKQADWTLLVLSAAYVNSEYTISEWAAAFQSDPKGMTGRLLPIRIQPCEVVGLLGSIMFIDLVDLDEGQAREQLLAGVVRERVKPISVSFPGLNRPIFPGELPPIWNVPYPQNPLFIGREELLSCLFDQLLKGRSTVTPQPQAMSGLGGIGKTQIALEYAYRHRHSYQAVLWVYAETRDTFTSSYLTLATWLNLPEKDEQESAFVVTAVKNWLQRNTGWLLILDNADDLTLVRDFLPPSVRRHLYLLPLSITQEQKGLFFCFSRAHVFQTILSVDVKAKAIATLTSTLKMVHSAPLLIIDAIGKFNGSSSH